MDCSPNSLAAAAKCFCFNAQQRRQVRLSLLCAWANAGGAPPCTLPTAPVDLGASAGDSEVTLTWPAGTGATGYNIKRALVTGGPYTIIGTSAASPYVDNTAVNFTTYYYVVSSTNACGESAGNSLESHATPAAVFSYAPATAIITWTDVHGVGQTGNLAFFNANADFASVTAIDVAGQALTSLSGLNVFPALTSLICSSNLLTVLDTTHNPLLSTLLCYSNLLTGLDLTQNPALAIFYGGGPLWVTPVDITHNPALQVLDLGLSHFTTLDISSNPLLVYLGCSPGNLTVLAVNTILSQLVTFGVLGGTVNLSNQTPAAPPSAGPPNGIVAKAALLAEVPPWTVTTD